MLDDLLQDVRFGVRTLVKNPGFTAVAVTALALGIGANATVFSMVNGVLFKSLPFDQNDRIVYLSSSDVRTGRADGAISYADYYDFRAQAKSFTALAAYTGCLGNLSDDLAFPENYRCNQFSANAFTVIGQKPILGRDFIPADEQPGATPSIILTYRLWEKRYAKDPAVIGRTIHVNSVPATVIGVMPKGIIFPPETQFWQSLPLAASAEHRRERDLDLFGRLAPGGTIESARAEMTTLARRRATEFPDTNRDSGIRVQRFNEMATPDRLRVVFLALLGAVGFVLLIACANVANLLLARALGRTREISIRAALGAGRWRVVRQLLVESLLLSSAGGGFGWLIAQWGIRTFDAAVVPTGKPEWIDFSMDYRAFWYLAAVSIGTGLLFGLVPALRLAKLDVNSGLKDGGRGAGAGLRGRSLAGALVVTEMALAVILLSGAGLMVRSFLYAYSSSIGVPTANLLTMRVTLPDAKYPKASEKVTFYQNLTQQLAALPGVDSVTKATALPGSPAMSEAYELEGAAPVDAKRRPVATYVIVDAAYFSTLRAPALRGRAFTDIDGVSGPPVVIVNSTFAARQWPHQEPLGKRLRIFRSATATPAWLTVVGIAPDIAQKDMRNVTPEPALYVPFRQDPQRSAVILAHTRVAPASLGEAFRRTVQSLDKDLPVRDVGPLEDQLARTLWPLRIFGGMFAIFAGVALLLASVGLYAVVAQAVNQRTHELGVRVALGASRAAILRMVFAQGMRQTGIGLAIGLAAAFGVTRVIGALLVGISPTDPITFGSVALILTLAAIAGCAVPARRATRVDPAVALRHQ